MRRAGVTNHEFVQSNECEGVCRGRQFLGRARVPGRCEVTELLPEAEIAAQLTGARLQRGKSRQDYETPPAFFNAVESRFGRIIHDLAATEANTKVPGSFFSPQQDALHQEWWPLCSALPTGWLWLNPPFADIGPWARRCYEQSQRGANILMLVPASVGANWYRDWVHRKAGVLALNGRLTFVGSPDPYPKDLILCCYSAVPGGFDVWTWADQE